MENNISPRVKVYLETILWAETDNADDRGGEPLDKNYGVDNFAPESIEQATKDVEAFWAANAATLADPACSDEGGIAHDFWLTRCGHGAGFWDGDYPKAIGDALTKSAKSFGERYVVVGDDGQIYIER